MQHHRLPIKTATKLTKTGTRSWVGVLAEQDTVMFLEFSG